MTAALGADARLQPTVIEQALEGSARLTSIAATRRGSVRRRVDLSAAELAKRIDWPA